jgi:hypothetical protein
MPFGKIWTTVLKSNNARGKKVNKLFSGKQARNTAKSKYIDCHRCMHYYVTWDEDFPHGCRAMKFKGQQLPSALVYQSSGMSCLLYVPNMQPHGS